MEPTGSGSRPFEFTYYRPGFRFTPVIAQGIALTNFDPDLSLDFEVDFKVFVHPLTECEVSVRCV